MGIAAGHAELAADRGDASPIGHHAVARAGDELPVTEARGRGHDARHVGADELERAHALDGVGTADGVADTQPGEAVHLREGAQHDDIGPAAGEVDHALGRTGLDEVHVGLVDHHQRTRGEREAEFAQLRRREHGAGRVVRVAEIDERGAGRRRGVDCGGVMAQLRIERHAPHGRAQLLGEPHQLPERRPRTGDAAAGCPAEREDVQQLARSRPDRDPLRGHPLVRGDGGDQPLRVLAIGVAPAVAERCEDRLARLGPGTERVLVVVEREQRRAAAGCGRRRAERRTGGDRGARLQESRAERERQGLSTVDPAHAPAPCDRGPMEKAVPGEGFEPPTNG